ncbi:MAG: hypothetical protein NWE93_10205 [Candidatus Bathyarchaeota archaeon]|nr:hypothetical protein [Candidatus Bathyarchaeota archaeon]
MIERVIENWLINTNEIGYQVPFCQYLLSENYSVLHLSTHGQMEQGKDIISLDEKGVPCAFQLKCGQLGLPEWRAIKGEITELIEVPINFPGIDKNIGHSAFLVTNGELTDPVRVLIDDLNFSNKKRGYSELKVITKYDLLKRFLKVSESLLPVEPADFKLFLELTLRDGKALINKEITSEFIELLLFKGKETKPELKRKIESGLLLYQYTMQNFEKCQNHIAVIDGWTLFGTYLLAVAEKYDLEPELWETSFNLVAHKIKTQFISLKKEFFSRKNFLESTWDGDLFYKSRLTMVLGWLSAFELFSKKADSSYSLDQQVIDYIKKHYTDLWYWGESATPFFIEMSLLLSLHNDSLSEKILIDLLANIVVENQLKDSKGLPDPYYTAEQVISEEYNRLYSLGEESEPYSFHGSSYHMSTIVNLIAKRKKRASITPLWKDLTKILKCEFKPQPVWKLLTWHCEEGVQNETFYEQPQSWAKLITEATTVNNSEFPKRLVNNPFAHYHLMCYPHRLSATTIKLIDK